MKNNRNIKLLFTFLLVFIVVILTILVRLPGINKTTPEKIIPIRPVGLVEPTSGVVLTNPIKWNIDPNGIKIEGTVEKIKLKKLGNDVVLDISSEFEFTELDLSLAQEGLYIYNKDDVSLVLQEKEIPALEYSLVTGTNGKQQKIVNKENRKSYVDNWIGRLSLVDLPWSYELLEEGWLKNDGEHFIETNNLKEATNYVIYGDFLLNGKGVLTATEEHPIRAIFDLSGNLVQFRVSFLPNLIEITEQVEYQAKDISQIFNLSNIRVISLSSAEIFSANEIGKLIKNSEVNESFRGYLYDPKQGIMWPYVFFKGQTNSAGEKLKIVMGTNLIK